MTESDIEGSRKKLNVEKVWGKFLSIQIFYLLSVCAAEARGAE